MALFLIVAPPLALSNVAILAPPTRKGCALCGLPAFVSFSFCRSVKGFIESIVKFPLTVRVLPPLPPK